MTKDEFLKNLGTPVDDYRALKKLEDQQKPAPFSWENVEQEGQLAVDVYETPSHVVIVSAVAGVRPDDIDITVSGDMVTIRGKRTDETVENERGYFYQECYFGAFSRTIVLPVHIYGDRSEATLKNGLLTLRIPKAKADARIEVKEVE